MCHLHINPSSTSKYQCVKFLRRKAGVVEIHEGCDLSLNYFLVRYIYLSLVYRFLLYWVIQVPVLHAYITSTDYIAMTNAFSVNI